MGRRASPSLARLIPAKVNVGADGGPALRGVGVGSRAVTRGQVPRGTATERQVKASASSLKADLAARTAPGSDRWEVDVLVAGEDGDASGAVMWGANGMRAPASAFHPLMPNSAFVKWKSGKAVEFSVRPISDAAKANGNRENIRASLNGVQKYKRTRRLIDFVRDWCITNPGYGVVIGGPGARPEFEELKKFIRKDAVRPLVKSSMAPCGLAAASNAIASLSGKRRALAFLEAVQVVQVVHVGSSFTWYGPDIDMLGAFLQMRRVKGQSFHDFARYSKIEERVLVVRLNWAASLDHVVVVDLLRGVIIDSEEEYSLQLTPDSLRLCAGGGSAARIGEVREIVALK